MIKFMNEITVGIPATLLYYKYKELWLNFFGKLGIKVVLSPQTDKEILDSGIKHSLDEACLAMKIYMGHVAYLAGKCDYILVPRLESVKKCEKLCTNFAALYDLTRATSDARIIHYNVDVDRKKSEEEAFIKLGKNLGFTRIESKSAYLLAKQNERILKKAKLDTQLNKIKNSKKIKILLAGHPYNLYDKFIGGQIVEVLEKCDVDVFYSDIYDDVHVPRDMPKISKANYWTYNREMIASIAYYEPQVDGIILVTSFPCGPDSLSNEMILRNVHIPITNLIMDEENSTTGLETRIESFIDIIEERKKINE